MLDPGTSPEKAAFIERGLAAREDALHTGEYFDADEVLAELDAMADRADAKRRE